MERAVLVAAGKFDKPGCCRLLALGTVLDTDSFNLDLSPLLPHGECWERVRARKVCREHLALGQEVGVTS